MAYWIPAAIAATIIGLFAVGLFWRCLNCKGWSLFQLLSGKAGHTATRGVENRSLRSGGEGRVERKYPLSSGKLFLLLALVLLIPSPGCSRAGPDSTQSSLLDPSVVQVRATVNTLFKAFNAHDLDAVMAVYDPRVVKMNPGLSAPQVGRDVVRKIYSDLFTQLPGVRDKVNRYRVYAWEVTPY